MLRVRRRLMRQSIHMEKPAIQRLEGEAIPAELRVHTVRLFGDACSGSDVGEAAVRRVPFKAQTDVYTAIRLQRKERRRFVSMNIWWKISEMRKLGE